MYINIRKVNSKDALILYDWVNKKDSLEQKLVTNNKISFENHIKWFNKRIDDEDTYIWIIEKDKINSIGQIRFEKYIDKYFDIDIYIIQSERKKGIAKLALNLAMNKIYNGMFRAIVKKNNYSSYNFFNSCNFMVEYEDKDKWVFKNIVKEIN